MASITHPDYASLVGPFFACGGKRGKKKAFALRIVVDTGPWLMLAQYKRIACPLLSAGTPKSTKFSL